MLRSRKSLKQEEKKDKIAKLQSQIVNMESLRNSGLSNVEKKDVDKLRSQLESEKKNLKKLANNAKYQQNHRNKRKKLIQDICAKDESAAKALKPINREHVGRPRIEDDQPLLLSTILEIVEGSSAADDRQEYKTFHFFSFHYL